MQVVLVFPKDSINMQLLAEAAKKHGSKHFISEGPCFVCTIRDSKIVSDLANIAGADNITIAKQVSRRFSDVVGAIVEVGIRTILPSEQFYVKAILSAKADYVERDIEFASAGMLVEKLVKMHAMPTRNEHEADRVILAVIGKRWAYVCAR